MTARLSMRPPQIRRFSARRLGQQHPRRCEVPAAAAVQPRRPSIPKLSEPGRPAQRHKQPPGQLHAGGRPVGRQHAVPDAVLDVQPARTSRLERS
eukprot:353295-Chlamydomonas_euryale.AAC.5